MFQSPSQHLKVEFQGGEPLLNFALIRYIVEESERQNDGRDLQFVITSNLSPLNEEILDFAAAHQIYFLYVPRRPRGTPQSEPAPATVVTVTRSLWPESAAFVIGSGTHSVSALMTSTAESLKQPEKIIDEYVRLDFQAVFLRYISPYGFAVKSANRIGYETEEFIDVFQTGTWITSSASTSAGVPIRELYSTLLCSRILTPYATGYVDCSRRPGSASSVLVYNYDGDVYAADEGRMLAEMGDKTFRLGSVHNSYKAVVSGQPNPFDDFTRRCSKGIRGAAIAHFCPSAAAILFFTTARRATSSGHRPQAPFASATWSLCVI